MSKRRSTSRSQLGKAFQQTAQSLLAIYRIYDVEGEVAEATASALGRLFERYLNSEMEKSSGRYAALYELVDDLKLVA